MSAAALYVLRFPTIASHGARHRSFGQRNRSGCIKDRMVTFGHGIIGYLLELPISARNSDPSICGDRQVKLLRDHCCGSPSYSMDSLTSLLRPRNRLGHNESQS